MQVQTFGPGQTQITIRGVSPDEQTGVTAVSYYLDEIPVTSAGQRTQPELYLYDTNQVEVLRGPQGTLWGEGAMGGMVHITTNKPNTEDYEASVLADVYSIDNGGTGYKLDAMANIPIVQDVLAVRVVVEDRYNAGWITDTIKSIPDPTLSPPARYVTSAVDKDANHSHNSSVRAEVRFTPTSHLTVDATYITNDINAATTNLGDVDAYNNVDLGLRPSKDVSELGNLTATYVLTKSPLHRRVPTRRAGRPHRSFRNRSCSVPRFSARSRKCLPTTPRHLRRRFVPFLTPTSLSVGRLAPIIATASTIPQPPRQVMRHR